MEKKLKPVSEFMDEIDKNYKHTWYKSAFWFLVREIPNLPKTIKWRTQRLFRGYSDCDLWGLDEHLAKLIVKRLKAFRKIKRHGIPCDFAKGDSDEDFEKGLIKWEEIIDEMIWTFEYVINDYCFGVDEVFEPKYNKEKAEELGKRYEKGIKLFAKYFSNLWD